MPAVKKAAATKKAAPAKKPVTKSVTKAVVKKAAADTGVDVKVGNDDKVLFMSNGKLQNGVVVKSGAKVMSLTYRKGEKTVNVDVDKADILAVSTPNGLRVPNKIVMEPYAGQGFLTEAGKQYLAKHPQNFPGRLNNDDIFVGDTVRILQLPFGYPLKDAVLTLGGEYVVVGYQGELVITRSDIAGEIAMFHDKHAEVSKRS